MQEKESMMVGIEKSVNRVTVLHHEAIHTTQPVKLLVSIGKTVIPVSARFKELAQHPPHKRFGA